MPGTTERIPPRTVLAFDFGLRRIGVAVGQTVTGSATPVTTLKVSTPTALMLEIESLIEDWHPDTLLVGQPGSRDGKPGISDAIERFAKMLRKTGLTVNYVDEARSSIEATGRLRRARQFGQRRRVRKQDIDAESARIIAERWLNQSSFGA